MWPLEIGVYSMCARVSLHRWTDMLFEAVLFVEAPLSIYAAVLLFESGNLMELYQLKTIFFRKTKRWHWLQVRRKISQVLDVENNIYTSQIIIATHVHNHLLVVWGPRDGSQRDTGQTDDWISNGYLMRWLTGSDLKWNFWWAEIKPSTSLDQPIYWQPEGVNQVSTWWFVLSKHVTTHEVTPPVTSMGALEWRWLVHRLH